MSLRIGPRWHTPFVLTICAAILSCTLTYPFNNDNSLYAYMAELLLKGHMPYLGSWDQNYPGVIAVHAMQIVLTGHSQLAFHLFDVALQLCGSYMLLRIGTRLYDRRAGALAAILAALYYVQQGLWMAGERDTYVSILLFVALYLLITSPERTRLGCGVLLGCAFLFRPTYGLYPVIGVLWIGWSQRSWKSASHLLVGASIPVVAVVTVYAILGGLRELWEATMLFNLRVYSGAGVAFSFWEPVRLYWIAVLPFLLGLRNLWRTQPQRGWLLSALLLASVISLVVLYRHSVYHYHPAMTLFVLISALGWSWLLDRLPRNVLKPVGAIVIIAFFMVQTLRGNTIQHVLRGLADRSIQSLDDSYALYEDSPQFGWRVQKAVAEYLRVKTQPGDRVQMFGPYSYPQYAASLLTSSRFQTLHAVTMRGQSGELQPFQLSWRTEYERSLQQEPPVYFIVCDAPDAFRQYYGGRLGHEILQEDWTSLGAWLRMHYSAETKIGAFTLYKRLSS